MKLQKDKENYMNINLWKDGVHSSFAVYRLVAELFIDDKPKNYKELHVNHKNGVHDDNHIENLEYMTAKKTIIIKHMF